MFNYLILKSIFTIQGLVILSKVLFGFSIISMIGVLVLPFFAEVSKRLRSTLDRIIFSFLLGTILLTLVVTILNRGFYLPITSSNLFILITVSCLALFYSHKYRGTKTVDVLGDFNKNCVINCLFLLLLFFIGLELRIENTFKYSDRILQTDPHRYLPIVRHIVREDFIPTWAPLIAGEQPIFRMQGSFTLAAILAKLMSLSPWQIWKYGSVVMGTTSILSVYLIGKYMFHRSSVLGIISAIILGVIPVHILRSSAGFPEAWALPFLPVLLWLFMENFRAESLANGILFGIFAIGMSTMSQVSSFFLVEFFIIYIIILYSISYVIGPGLEERTAKVVQNLFTGNLVGIMFVIFWSQTYLGVSIWEGFVAVSNSATKRAENRLELSETFQFFQRHLSSVVLFLLILGVLILFFNFIWEKCTGSEFQNGIFEGLDVPKISFIAIALTYFPALIILANYGFPTVIPGLYRYLVAPLPIICVLSAVTLFYVIYLLKNQVSTVIDSELIFNCVGIFIVLFSIHFTGLKPSEPPGWPPVFKSDYVQGGEWIKNNTPTNAVIVTSWYGGDFLRSNSERKIIPADYLRHRYREAALKADLNLRPLTNPAQIVRYASSIDAPVYIYKNKHGPKFELDPYKSFKTIHSFQTSDKNTVIYKVQHNLVNWEHFDLLKTSQSKKKNIALLGQPLAGTDSGRVVNKYKLNDGSMGKNTSWEAATTHPATDNPQSAWFGVRFGTPVTVSEAEIYTGFSKSQLKRINHKRDLRFTPAVFVLQYWEQGEWQNILPPQVPDNQGRSINVRFRPITSKRFRFKVIQPRARNGKIRGKRYRSTCLELRLFTTMSKSPKAWDF